MVKTGDGIILALFLSALLLSSCVGGGQNTNSIPSINSASAANANAAKTNVEELSLLVNVPYEAEDIAWKQNPATQAILAVLRFSAADAAKLVAEAETAGAGQPISLQIETWFPDELIAQGEMSGDGTVKGTAYPANAFFQAPYNKGRITRIEGVDYFVLELYSK